jgi:hypothetical protein
MKVMQVMRVGVETRFDLPAYITCITSITFITGTALAAEPISLQLLSQRAAIDAENVGSAALIAR